MIDYRRVGYTLLPGRSFDYVLHLRPMEWPVVSAHILAGFVVAAAISTDAISMAALVPALIAWVPLLNAGTLALNSYFDKDDGDIGYLVSPPQVPKYLGLFGTVLMLIGLVPAALVSGYFVMVYTVCVIMSFLYSCPPFRLKSVPGVDLLINAAGFGGLTFFAGSLTFSSAISVETVFLSAGFFFLFSGFYPLTQLYQFDQDMERGDRTLVVAIGKKRGVEIAISGTAVAFLLFFVGTNMGSADVLSLVLLFPLAAWVCLLVPWRSSVGNASDESNRRGMYRALWIWALTDIVLVGWALAGSA